MNWYKLAQIDDDNWIDVRDCSSISSVSYDPDLEIFRLKFLSGGEIGYQGVPLEIYNNFLQASSKIDFFKKFIRGQFDVV